MISFCLRTNERANKRGSFFFLQLLVLEYTIEYCMHAYNRYPRHLSGKFCFGGHFAVTTTSYTIAPLALTCLARVRFLHLVLDLDIGHEFTIPDNYYYIALADSTTPKRNTATALITLSASQN